MMKLVSNEKQRIYFSEELNLNGAFRKNVTFNSIEIYKNQAFAFFRKMHFLKN